MRIETFPFIEVVDEEFVDKMQRHEYVVTFPYLGMKLPGEVANLVYKEDQDKAYALKVMKSEDSYYLADGNGKMLTDYYNTLVDAVNKGIIAVLGEGYFSVIEGVFHVNNILS